MQAKRRLLYIMHSPVIGGVETAVFSAIPLLHEAYELRVLVLGKLNTPLYQSLDKPLQGLFQSFDHPIYQYPRCMSALITAIKEFDPDLMVSSLWRASWLASMYKRKHKGVSWYACLHNTHFFHFADRYFSKRALRRSDVVLCDSEAAKDFAKNFRLNDKPLHVLSMLTLSKPAGPTGNIPRGDGPIKFLFLGRMHKQKNLPLAIAFLAMLRADGYDVHFDIYGRDDGDKPSVESAIHKYKLQQEVRFCGEVLPYQREGIYGHYHFYLQFSEVEGMAMSVVEAMQFGLIPIVTPVGEIARYTVNGESALWLEEHKLDRLKAAWEMLIMHPERYSIMSQKARQRFSDYPSFAETLLASFNNP